jgi:hypothetical protein
MKRNHRIQLFTVSLIFLLGCYESTSPRLFHEDLPGCSVPHESERRWDELTVLMSQMEQEAGPLQCSGELVDLDAFIAEFNRENSDVMTSRGIPPLTAEELTCNLLTTNDIFMDEIIEGLEGGADPYFECAYEPEDYLELAQALYLLRTERRVCSQFRLFLAFCSSGLCMRLEWGFDRLGMSDGQYICGYSLAVRN